MARRTQTYAIRLAVEGGGQVKAELVSVGQSGEQSLKRIESAGERASGGLKGLGRQAELLRTGIRTLAGALAGVATVGGLTALVDRSISAANAIGKTADKIGVGVEALQELRFAAKASGVEQQTLDMALQRFTRRAAEAGQGTGEAKDALAQMGIALRDQSGNLRSSEDLLGDVADAFARVEDPAERVRLAFKLFDSEGVALVNLLRGGSDALEQKVRAANERVVASLDAERDALGQTERQRFVAQALSRLSAEATAEQRREVEQHAAEISKLNKLLAAGAIDQATYARAVEDANDRALRSSQAWTDGATRFLKDYVAESNDAATATERAFANAFGGAEDALVGFIASGKLEFQSLVDSVLADLARMTVRQTLTAPLAGTLQSALAGGDLVGLFHEGGVAGERPPTVRYADAAVFDHPPRYHGGGFAGSGLLPDEVPIIARRGELVVPPERVVREEKTAREQRPITVVINVTAADASSFRASQGQIAADMARAIDRASRNR
jgi:lambda family phage tail tape measure protein